MVVSEKERVEISKELNLNQSEQLVTVARPWRVENFGDIFPLAVEPLGMTGEDNKEFELRVDKPFTVGATGHKRNGKSLFLTRAGVVALVMGLPVWSNYPIEFDYRPDEKTQRHCISKPLDWRAMYMLSSELEYGVVIISEIQQWLDSRASMRLNNRLFSYILRQVGKRHLSLWYDCFSLDTIEKRLPAETDVEIYCEDARKTFWGKTKGTHLEEGEYIKLSCYARTNAWLGFTSYDSGVVPEYWMYGKPYWRCYDTSYLFDPFEALTPIALDLAPMKITNKSQQNNGYEASLRSTVEQLISNGQDTIETTELLKSAGIDQNNYSKYGKVLSSWGIERTLQNSHGKRSYILTGYIREQ